VLVPRDFQVRPASSDPVLDGSRVKAIVARPDPVILERLGQEVAAGTLRVTIDTTYRLDAVPAAFGHFANGKTGKIAVAID
jgi:NADPH:quinone reductase-like Zn-dependent oxidoreductase